MRGPYRGKEAQPLPVPSPCPNCGEVNQDAIVYAGRWQQDLREIWWWCRTCNRSYKELEEVSNE